MWVSGISAVLDVIVAILHKIPWWAWPLTGICTYFITYCLSQFFLRQYVVYRIKPLYQLLLSKDIITSKLAEELRQRSSNDLVDDIQDGLNNLVTLADSEIDRMMQKEKERTEFLRSVSHEIKTPVFNIQGYAQTLLDGALDDPTVSKQYVERVVRSANRLADMVEDIEKLSRYESGGMIMYFDTFNIVDLFNVLIDTHIVNAREKNIKFKFASGTFSQNEEVLVYADEFRIGHVLENLFTNALKFGKQNGTVTIGIVDMFDKVLIEITDDGIGIPSEDLTRVFEKMYRVEKSRSREFGGTGLGLSIVKMIIDAHNEYITVRSEVGKGTTFSFTLTKSDTRDKNIR